MNKFTNNNTSKVSPNIPLLDLSSTIRYGIELEMLLTPSDGTADLDLILKNLLRLWKEDKELQHSGYPLVSSEVNFDSSIPTPLDSENEYLTLIVNICEHYLNYIPFKEEQLTRYKTLAEKENFVKMHIMEYFIRNPAEKAKFKQLVHSTKLPVWGLVKDMSLNSSAKNRLYGFEFVSPILYRGGTPASCEGAYQTIKNMYNFIEKYNKITVDVSCSTHVHLSPKGGWSLSKLKALACSAFYFEEAISQMLPPSRVKPESFYAQEFKIGSELVNSGYHNNLSNFGYDSFDKFKNGKDSLLICLKQIETIETKVSLETAKRVPLNIAAIPLLVELLNHKDIGKNHSWNFRNLTVATDVIKDPKGTVEFRRPPGSQSAEEAFHWAEFATAFAVSAIDKLVILDTVKLDEKFILDNLLVFPSDLKGLQQFMATAMPDWRLQQHLRPNMTFFQPMSPPPANTTTTTITTTSTTVPPPVTPPASVPDTNTQQLLDELAAADALEAEFNLMIASLKNISDQ